MEKQKYILLYYASNGMFKALYKKIFEKEQHILNFINEKGLTNFEIIKGELVRFDFTLKAKESNEKI